jgi:DUF4097 and DUF4098 domain-containing protein YvlB
MMHELSGATVRSPAAPALAVVPALLALLLAVPVSGHAQSAAEEWCRDADGRRGQHCEVRVITMRPVAGDLVVDVGANGSIEVNGYDGSDIRVTARVIGRARDDRRAREVAESVEIDTRAGGIRANGPRTRGTDGWSVSVRVQVPVGTALDARTSNGSVRVADTHAPVQVRTTNGSITLADVAGRVEARTTNGAVRASLSPEGTQDGVQLRTTNGSIHLVLPEHTSARLALTTTNGRIETELPIMVQGRVSNRQLTATLGNGGAEIRAATTNGRIRITRR